MEPAPVVIVGAGLAGLRTAERLRRTGYDGRLTLVGAEAHLPYDRPPLSKALLTAAEAPSAPLLRSADRYEELDLELRLATRATAVDPRNRTIELADGTTTAWAHLVVATGLVARTVTGWSAIAGVHTLRTIEDCRAIRAAAEACGHATVVGAGVLGSEIAAGLRQRGLEVALVDPLPQPLCRVVGEDVGGFVAGLHRDRGVSLHLGRTVAELTTRNGRATGVVLDDGSSWSTDLVVTAVGGVPDTAWLSGAGLDLDDGVVVDANGATSVPGVWAVGDVASVAAPRGGGHLRIEHWTAAGDLAATVGGNIVASLRGQPLEPHTDLPYMWTDQYDTKLQCLGLPRPGDRTVLLTGSFAEGAFLAAHVADGRVRAVSGARMAGALMRCRAAVAGVVPLDELAASAPWVRTKAPA